MKGFREDAEAVGKQAYVKFEDYEEDGSGNRVEGGPLLWVS